jgi:SAM-dependent methyltransferase/GT2 family glycosyltransferase
MKDYLKEYLFRYHWDPSKALLRAIEAKIINHLEFREPILDLGCGEGTFASAFLPRNCKVIGLDIRRRNILKAEKKNFYSGLIVANAANIAFKDNSFKCILINSFLEHIDQDNLARVLSEANRVLEKGGMAVVTVNNKIFGEADPMVALLKNLRLNPLARLWTNHRNRRLALLSLKDFSYWDSLFKSTNFRVLESRHYLPADSEKRFFMWNDLQYLGISRINLGSLIRGISKAMSFFGFAFHRRIVAESFSKALSADYLVDTDSGSCIFFRLAKINDAILALQGSGIEPKEPRGQIQTLESCDNPYVSVIIPSFDGVRGGNLAKLVADLKQQSFKEKEVIVVNGVSPQGKAINMGAGQARGKILLIADDDSRMGSPFVIENLVRVFAENKDIGMAGASIMVPPDANWLQRKAGEEFPRFGMKLVDRVTESDMACHGCCAIPKKVFEEVGRERENILRGLDPDLRYRMRKLGYKTVLAANTWVYHPLPATAGKLIKTFFRNGMGSAYSFKYQPQLIYDTDESLELKNFKPKKSFLRRISRFPIRIMRAMLELKFLRAAGYLIYAFGFYWGVLKYSLAAKAVK